MSTEIKSAEETPEQMFASKLFYNKWMQELTKDEVELIIDLMEEYHTQFTPAIVGDGWISVEDDLPEPNKPVNVFYESANFVDTNWVFNNKKWAKQINDGKDKVTHWQPLPAPPNGKEQPIKSVPEKSGGMNLNRKSKNKILMTEERVFFDMKTFPDKEGEENFSKTVLVFDEDDNGSGYCDLGYYNFEFGEWFILGDFSMKIICWCYPPNPLEFLKGKKFKSVKHHGYC